MSPVCIGDRMRLLLTLMCVSLCRSFEADRVSSLPGLASSLLSPTFSGFLHIAETRHVHYILVQSHRDPATDPVVFWTNGGPGCSGLLGLFSEMGPWRPAADKSLYLNPYSWTNISSMVFLSQPVGVGFSYSSEKEEYSDSAAALDNVQIVREFFGKFPELAGSGFYIASESYGGHYIPQWALLLLDDPVLSASFLGYLVGNPYTGFMSGELAWARTLWGLQRVPYTAWRSFEKGGCDTFTDNPYTYPEMCWPLLGKITEDLPGDLNPYALTYPTCPSAQGGAQGRQLRRVGARARAGALAALASDGQDSFSRLRSASIDAPSSQRPSPVHPQSLPRSTHRRAPLQLLAEESGPERIAYNPCTESYIAPYLNQEAVRAALHVDASPNDWSECSDPVFSTWPPSDYWAATSALFAEVLRHPSRHPSFRMLVFSGDVDGICATVGTQQWVFDLEAPPTNGSASIPLLASKFRGLWEPYFVSRQQAGYMTLFEQNLSFVTVHSAGHEVPGYQPRRAFALYNGFLNGALYGLQDVGRKNDVPKTPGSTRFDDKALSVLIILAVLSATVAFAVLIYRAACAADVSKYDLLAPEVENPLRDSQGGGRDDEGADRDDGVEHIERMDSAIRV